MTRDPGGYCGDDVVPVPDPTRLTLAALRESFERLEIEIDEKVSALKEIHVVDLRAAETLLNTRIDSVCRETALRFELAEAARREMKHDAVGAQSAALLATREFVLQQNAATKEQLSALAQNWSGGHAALTGVVDDVKLRLASLESARATGRQASTSTYALLGVLLTVIWIAITVLALFHR